MEARVFSTGITAGDSKKRWLIKYDRFDQRTHTHESPRAAGCMLPLPMARLAMKYEWHQDGAPQQNVVSAYDFHLEKYAVVSFMNEHEAPNSNHQRARRTETEAPDAESAQRIQGRNIMAQERGPEWAGMGFEQQGHGALAGHEPQEAPRLPAPPLPAWAGAMRICTRCGCYEPFADMTDECCRAIGLGGCVF